jgi:hypothetical protein
MIRSTTRLRRIALILTVVSALIAAAAETAHATAVGDYGSTETITCTKYLDAYGRVTGRTVVINSPFMTSASGLGITSMSYQPYIYQVTNTGYSFRGTGVEVETYRGMTSGVLTSQQMTANGAGVVRVAIMYRWYSNGILVDSLFIWAGTHYLNAQQNRADGTTALWYHYQTGPTCDLT